MIVKPIDLSKIEIKSKDKMNINLTKVETDLMRAAKSGDTEKLKVILELTDIHIWSQANDEGQAALIVAIINNQKESVKIICNASKNLDDAKLIKSHLLNFKFSDEQDLAHYAMHRINNVIFQLRLEEALESKIDDTKKVALKFKV